MYKTVSGRNGFRYMKDSRFISKKDVPLDVLARLKGEAEVDTIVPEPQPKVCVVCKVPAKLTRYLDMQTVVLCQDHYDNLTLGKLANIVRSTHEEKEESKERVLNEEAKTTG